MRILNSCHCSIDVLNKYVNLNRYKLQMKILGILSDVTDSFDFLNTCFIIFNYVCVCLSTYVAYPHASD